MDVEINLPCSVDNCPQNVGYMCRACNNVTINKNGICSTANLLTSLHKPQENMEQKQSNTQQLKAEIRSLLERMDSNNENYGEIAPDWFLDNLRELSAV